MQPKDTAQEYDPMTTQKTTENWLRRRAAALLTLLVLAGVCLAVLGSLRAQAHTPQAASVPVAAAAPAVGSLPDARAYEQSMNRLRDINAVVAPTFDAQPVVDGSTDYRADRAYFHSLGINMAASAAQNDTHQREMNRLRDINAVAAPSDPGASSHSVARDYAPYMYRLLELNTMDDPAAGGLPPTRDATQRTGPY